MILFFIIYECFSVFHELSSTCFFTSLFFLCINSSYHLLPRSSWNDALLHHFFSSPHLYNCDVIFSVLAIFCVSSVSGCIKCHNKCCSVTWFSTLWLQNAYKLWLIDKSQCNFVHLLLAVMRILVNYEI